MHEFIKDIIDEIKERKPSKDELAKIKIKLAGKHKLRKIPTDIEILLRLDEKDIKKAEKFLVTKPVRTLSGVAVVAIMSKPGKCPHGKCIYCPGGIGSEFGDVPQSYTGYEPSTMRGIRNDYDAYLQVMNRLEQYIVIGQNPEKIELIIMGGTYPFFPKDYQISFARDAILAMNDFSDIFYRGGELDLKKFKIFFELPGDKNDKKRVDRIKDKLLKLKKESSLKSEQEKNEKSNIRCVGLTIETKPDYGFKEHGNLMLELGCTRVELGIQTVYNDVLKKINRGHNLHDSEKSISELKDLGFKLNFHLMPGLPGVTKKMEEEGLKQIFSNPSFRPDMVKIYPTMVFKNTPLHDLYRSGKYSPLRAEEAAELIAEFMGFVPAYCRVMRIQRDIPSALAIDGAMRNNLRQYVDKLIIEKGIKIKDIRAREIGHVIRDKDDVKLNPVINIMEYDASGGKEFFISMDDAELEALLGFCRLRFPSKSLREEITDDSALIRELHVFGKAVGLGKKGDVQHKGLGKQLVEKAEKIAVKAGKKKMIVISGIGVRGYYRKLGYEREGPYMVKKI